MKKISVFIVIFLISQFSYGAINFSVVGPCSLDPILKAKVTAKAQDQNIGQLSVDLLKKSKLPFIGDENKIDSINSTPVGEAAIEILSRKEMRAYGWCYYVNGKQPKVYPNEVKVNSLTKDEQWIFGYAHYVSGEWVSMCEPSWKVKPDFLCKDKK